MVGSGLQISLKVALLTLLISVSPVARTMAVEPAVSAGEVVESAIGTGDGYEKIIVLLREQEQKHSLELRQIKREIAALSQQLDKPGIAEIIGGIGYILGLFGIAAYVASRNRKGTGKG